MDLEQNQNCQSWFTGNQPDPFPVFPSNNITQSLPLTCIFFCSSKTLTLLLPQVFTQFLSLPPSWLLIHQMVVYVTSESCCYLHMNTLISIIIIYFKKDFIYLFLEREEREREKYQCVFASHVPPSGDLACKPGMCPNWESNW